MLSVVFPYPDYENLGVGYLMAACTKAGHRVGYVFYEAYDSYLNQKHDCDFAQLATRVLEHAPDVAALSCVTDNFQTQLSLAAELKARRPDLHIIFGGVHPSLLPHNVMANAAVDCVIVGEGEESMCAYLGHYERFLREGQPMPPVPGALFSCGGQLVDATADYCPPQDLDALLPPMFTGFYEYIPSNNKEHRLMASRGCPFKCSYCFNSFNSEHRTQTHMRRRSVGNVIAEILDAKTNKGIDRVRFLDDCFTHSRKWLTEFCAQYSAVIGLPFACTSRPESLDEEVVAMLKSAGCIGIHIGIQSFSETLCKTVLDRYSNNEKIRRGITLCRKYGIMSFVDHMFGIPTDTLEEQVKAVGMYNEIRPDWINIYWLTYYPRTRIVDIALDMGLLNQQDVTALESGLRLHKASYINGGDLENAAEYHGLWLILNWLPHLPRWLVSALLRYKLYRHIGTTNYYVALAIPRAILSLTHRQDMGGREHLRRFVSKLVYGLRKPAARA